MSTTELTAADLMTREVVTATPDETLRGAAQRMHARRIQCLLVPRPTSEGGLGIIAVKDIVQILGDTDEAALDDLRVSDAMTCPVFTVQDDMRIGDCIGLMRMAGIRRAPVLDGKQLVGILSFTDILGRAVA